jgi:opacity protein-like surface antigen
MKSFIAGAAALAVLSTTAAALAQDQNRHQNNQGPQGGRSYGQRQGARYNAPPHPAYRQGQAWHGHRLANRGGRWGYYQPRNGVQVFINIPL